MTLIVFVSETLNATRDCALQAGAPSAFPLKSPLVQIIS